MSNHRRRWIVLAATTIAAFFVGFGWTYEKVGSAGETSGVYLPFLARQARAVPPAPTASPTTVPLGTPTATAIPSATATATAIGSSTPVTLTSAMTQTIPLTGLGPQGLDIDPLTGWVYVGNNGNVIANCPTPTATPAGLSRNTMSIVDPAAGREVARVATDLAPIWTQVDVTRGVVYVANSGGDIANPGNGTVSIHTTGTGERVGTIDVGGRPHAFGLNASAGILIVSNTNDASQTFVARVDLFLRQVLEQQSAPAKPHGIAYDPDRTEAYIVGAETGDVAVARMGTGEIIDTYRGVTTTAQAGSSNMNAYSRSNRRLFVSQAAQIDGEPAPISVVDTVQRQVIGSVSFGGIQAAAWGMQVEENTRLLYVALPNLNAVGVVDVESLRLLALVPVGSCPYAVRLDPLRGLGYSTNMLDNSLSVIDLRRVASALGRDSAAGWISRPIRD